MEQKKMLWVMMAVSLLLVVLLGMGMFLPYFSRGPLPVVEDSREDPQVAKTRFDPIEYIREGDIAGVEEAEPVEEEFVAVANEIVIGESEEPQREPPVEEASSEVELVEAAPGAAASPSEPIAAPPTPSPKRASSLPSQTAPAVPMQKQTPPAPKKTAPAKTTIAEYWIQVGSFSKSSQAEENKEKLATQGVPSVIRTKAVGGSTYFRVRVGPYDSKAEAEKFLGWIQTLPDYSSSYISAAFVTRTR